MYSLSLSLSLSVSPCTEGELVSGVAGGGGDLDGVMEGEEGGGWEVGDDDLELPPDLVSWNSESCLAHAQLNT